MVGRRITNTMSISIKKLNLFVSFAILFLLLVGGSGHADYSFSNDADAVENAANSVFMLEVYDSRNRKIAVGSGFVIFEPDILATNYHVISDGAYVVAISDESVPYQLQQLCIADKAQDIALLRFDVDHGFEPLIPDTTGKLKRSSPVVAIGSPAGLKNTVSIGNISAFFDQNGKNWIQFTAPISSGSSGGVLLNDQGHVIGITTATYASTQNVNLAVRVEKLMELYRKWDGKTTRPMGRVTGKTNTSMPSYSTGQIAEGKVWISGSGKKYHNNPECSKMRSPREIDLLEAIQMGYEPCGKCYK